MCEKESKIIARIPGDEETWELSPLETSPCTLACPTRINARGYVSLIADGRYEEALALIRERNPFPGVCGRICPRPCEAACTRGGFDEAIAICALKSFVFDIEMKRGIDPAEPLRIHRREKVAVIGAGPAGLSAAVEFARAGYPVTIFEAADEPGGMMNVIPEFRLPGRVVRREVRAILDSGVGLVTGTVFGKDITWNALRRRGFRALLLATGARLPSWCIGAAGMEGVLHALDILRIAGELRIDGSAVKKTVPESGLSGKSVVVAGDGVMALDAARTAVRLGCRAVKLVAGRGRELMPVQAGNLDAAGAEGVEFIFLSRPLKLLKSGGKIRGISCIRLKEEEPDATGRRDLTPVKGSRFDVAADIVIDAYSRSVDIRSIRKGLALSLTPAGTLAVDGMTMEAGSAGVFAAGDLVTGPRSVVEAIASGQKAARGIQAYLGGKSIGSVFDPSEGGKRSTRGFALDRPPETRISRMKMPAVQARRRRRDFIEVEKGYSEWAAKLEAQRCLRCGPCAECTVCVDICGKKDMLISMDDLEITVHAGREFWSRKPSEVLLELEGEKSTGCIVRTVCRVQPEFCIGCGRCEEVCGYHAVRVEAFPGGRFMANVSELACKGCGNCVAVCPTGAMEQANFERRLLRDALSAVEPGKTKVLFTCHWARPEKLALPDYVLVVEVMCTGRLTPALLLGAVERGATGVMVCGCTVEGCHYGFGRENGGRVVERTLNILSLLGYDRNILIEGSCTPHDFHSAVRRWAVGKF